MGIQNIIDSVQTGYVKLYLIMSMCIRWILSFIYVSAIPSKGCFGLQKP